MFREANTAEDALARRGATSELEFNFVEPDIVSISVAYDRTGIVLYPDVGTL